MGLKRLPYKDLKTLIGRNLSRKENPDAVDLMKELKYAKGRGYLTKKELRIICKWKSARAIWLIEENTHTRIKNFTQKAFKTRSERTKIELLTSLRGVSIPMASAILMLINPKSYGVIDIRVWQLLYAMKSVTKKASGVGFNFNNWFQYLMIIRYYAKMFKVKSRDIERTLFNAHKMYQRENLY